jgi:glycogen debranching enzyme
LTRVGSSATKNLPEAPREWLVANGRGGYASATVTGAITRRYHGFLVAAQPAPFGRVVVLTDTEVDIEREDGSIMNLRENGRFLDFTLDVSLPSWRYAGSQGRRWDSRNQNLPRPINK